MPEEGNLIASAIGVIVTGVISGVTSGVILQIAVDARRYREEQLRKIIEILDSCILRSDDRLFLKSVGHPLVPHIRNQVTTPFDATLITRDLRFYAQLILKFGNYRFDWQSRKIRKKLENLIEWCNDADRHFSEGAGTPIEAMKKIRSQFD